MLFEDQVKREVREAWRQLQVLKRNLETARQSIRIAAARFDSAVSSAYAPKGVGGSRVSVPGLSGQNIQNALSAILSAQNNMIGFWVSYEQNRLNIYRDMGIMEIGPDNVWDDPFYRELCGAGDFCPDGVYGAQSPAESLLGSETGTSDDSGSERLDESAELNEPREGGDVWSLDGAIGRADADRGDDRSSGLRDTDDQGDIRRVGWKQILPFGH